MDNVVNNFFMYCDKIGVRLLRGDKDFIIDKVRGLPTNFKRKLLKQYITEWQCEKDDNKSRFRANTFLREFMEDICQS